MSCHVVTTLNPATCVSHAVKGCFIELNTENLIISKGSTIEVYTLIKDDKHERLSLYTDFSICGIVTSLEVIQLRDNSACSLFVLSDRNIFTVFSYNSNVNKIIIEGKGALEKEHSRSTDMPITTVVDHQKKLIFVSTFPGVIFSIPYKPQKKIDSKGKSRESSSSSSNLSIPFQPSALSTGELDIHSMAPTYGISNSSIAVLLGEQESDRIIKLFECEANDMMESDNKTAITVESSTHMLIPVPDPIGGLISIGEYIIAYHDRVGMTKELSIEPVVITSYTFLHDERECLLADMNGNIYCLELEVINRKVSKVVSSLIGSVPAPNSVVYLGNNLVYCGSRQGDSTLIKLYLTNDKNKGKYRIEILQTFENIGPIVDFCIFDYDQQGKKTMVCCSGVDKDGSLRVVENGVGFIEEESMDIPFINNVWTLKLGTDDSQHDTIVTSTTSETVVITPLNDPSIPDKLYSYSAIALNEMTLAIGNISNNRIIQVTPSSVRLMTMGLDGALLNEWRPPFSKTIAIAKLTADKCVLYYEGGALVYLQVENNDLIQKCSKEFKDVSCINITLAQPRDHLEDYVVVGMSSSPKIFLLYLKDLSVAQLLTIDTLTGTKDVALLRMNKTLNLLALLGNGHLFNYELEERLRLQNGQKTLIGTYCKSMFIYFERNEYKVFVNGFQPTIVSNAHGRLFFSAVNLKNVYAATLFNQHFILVKKDQLVFGRTNEKQRFHYSKVALDGDMPNCIEYQPTTKTLAVGVSTKAKHHEERTGSLKVFDAQTFQVLDTYSFQKNELVESLAVKKFDYDDREYLFVGTAVDVNEEPERNKGRVYVLHINDQKKCELVDIVELPGIVYSMSSYENSIAFGVNGSIYTLDRFHPKASTDKLSIQPRVNKNVAAISMDSKDGYVLVGDLMFSMSLFKNKTSRDPTTLERVATDNSPSWNCAVKVINKNLFIGADGKNDLYTVAREEMADGLEKLTIVAGYHLGHLVNRFREGTLCYISDGSMLNTNPITFVTVDGSIGVIQTVPIDKFEFLYELQLNIADVTPFYSRNEHEAFHRYIPLIKNCTPKPYIDGDLLKSFMSLDRAQRARVLNGETVVPMTERDIERQIADIII